MIGCAEDPISLSPHAICGTCHIWQVLASLHSRRWRRPDVEGEGMRDPALHSIFGAKTSGPLSFFDPRFKTIGRELSTLAVSCFLVGAGGRKVVWGQPRSLYYRLLSLATFHSRAMLYV